MGRRAECCCWVLMAAGCVCVTGPMDGRHASVMARLSRGLGCGWEYAESECVAEAMRQLDEYFAGGRMVFDVPLLFVGTGFQQEVWRSLLAIPYGRPNHMANWPADRPAGVGEGGGQCQWCQCDFNFRSVSQGHRQ